MPVRKSGFVDRPRAAWPGPRATRPLRVRRWAGRDRRPLRRGAALVEAALVLPICLTFILGVFEYGRYISMLQVLNHSAREGVRYALTHTQPIVIDGVTEGSADQDVINVVQRTLSTQSLQSQVVQVYRSDALGNNLGTWTDAQFGQMICVRITGNYRVITPQLLFLPSSIPIQVQSIMRSEAN